MDRYSYLQYFADFLSVATIALCSVIKFPQIIKIQGSQSIEGISLKSLLLELTSYTIATCYNYTNGYSLLSYMEYIIILFQEYVLIYMVLEYMNLVDFQTSLAAAFYFVISIGFLIQIIPKLFLSFLMPLCIPISGSSKLIQLMVIVKTGRADSVSLITWLISVVTNITRIFTIWMDSADVTLIANSIISTILSFSIVCAILYYRKKQSRRE